MIQNSDHFKILHLDPVPNCHPTLLNLCHYEFKAGHLSEKGYDDPVKMDEEGGLHIKQLVLFINYKKEKQDVVKELRMLFYFSCKRENKKRGRSNGITGKMVSDPIQKVIK